MDQMHLAISPVLLGCGESFLAGIDSVKLGQDFFKQEQ